MSGASFYGDTVFQYQSARNISGLRRKSFFFQKADVLTTGTGAPVGNKLASQTVGPRGPILLQDFVFTDEMAHFNRERIPERVVHAKGAGMSLNQSCLQKIKIVKNNLVSDNHPRLFILCMQKMSLWILISSCELMGSTLIVLPSP